MKILELFNEAKPVDQIKRYTDVSRNISRELYKHHADNSTVPEYIDDVHIPTMDDITSKMLSKNMKLYTGVRHDPRTTVDANNIMHVPAYMSTSDRYSVAERFAQRQASRKDKYENDVKVHNEPAHVLEISAKKRQLAAKIANQSAYRDENEFLLPRNTKLQIVGEPEVYVSPDIDDKSKRELYLWQCIIVS